MARLKERPNTHNCDIKWHQGTWLGHALCDS